MNSYHHETHLRQNRRESGQALVESILVLVISVTLILGVVVQFNDAFRKWGNNYFGNYLACLLETGELPSLGGPIGQAAGVCQQLFEPFSLADGRPAIAADGSDSNSSSSDGDSANDDEGSSEASGEGGGGTASTRVRRGGGAPEFSDGGGSGGSDDGDESKKKKVNTGSTDVSSSGYLRSENSGGESEDGVTYESRFKVRYGKEDEDKEKKGNVNAGPSDSRAQKRISRFKVNKSEVNREVAEADLELGFGSYLRYLLIAAIILALVVFFGGQAVQISKSWD